MKLETIYNLILFIGDKEVQGQAYDPETYNLTLEEVNMEIMDVTYREIFEMAKSQQVSPEVFANICSRSILKPFRKTKPLEMAAQGITLGPDDYIAYESFDGIVSGLRRWIEPLDPDSANKRRWLALGPDPRQYPFVMATGKVFQFIPYDTTDAVLYYFRKPLVPYLDWAIKKDTAKVVFLPAGSRLVKADDGTLDLYDANGKIDSGLIKEGIEFGPYNPTNAPISTTQAYMAKTVELEWEERAHELFVTRLLKRVAINLQQDAILQYSQMQEKEGV